jgi:hypothetical protein
MIIEKDGGLSSTACRFRKLDFVDFIMHRDHLANVDIKAISSQPELLKVVNDFRSQLIDFGTASYHLEVCRLSGKLDQLSAQHGVSLERAMVLIAYCTNLDQTDPRHASLNLVSEELALLRSSKIVVQSTYADPPIRDRTMGRLLYNDIARGDRQQYLDHWWRAYPNEVAEITSNTYLLSKILAASYHGVDEVSERLADALEHLPKYLPNLDLQLKADLVTLVGRNCLTGLLELTFEPLSKHPELFAS